jgi:hypothetical protein
VKQSGLRVSWHWWSFTCTGPTLDEQQGAKGCQQNNGEDLSCPRRTVEPRLDRVPTSKSKNQLAQPRLAREELEFYVNVINLVQSVK